MLWRKNINIPIPNQLDLASSLREVFCQSFHHAHRPLGLTTEDNCFYIPLRTALGMHQPIPQSYSERHESCNRMGGLSYLVKIVVPVLLSLLDQGTALVLL